MKLKRTVLITFLSLMVSQTIQAASTQGSFIGVAAGGYAKVGGGFFPLLIKTNDSGARWEYPRNIFNTTKTIDHDFLSGTFQATACSGSDADSVCIAPGFFCKGQDCSSELPLIAVGRRDTNTWTYPNSVFNGLKIKIDPDFKLGFLNGANCTGSGSKAFCLASGVFFTSVSQFPVIALSSNAGKSWSYPSTVFSNLLTTLDPSFSGGFLDAPSCNKSVENSVCIATGAFCSGELCDVQLPLVALSKDQGKTWTYPKSAFSDVKTKIDPNYASGELKSPSCTGSGDNTICISAGSFFNSTITLPLIGLTNDGGNTWNYPASIFTNLPIQIGHDFADGFFNAGSCTGSGGAARCIAAGGYTTTTGNTVPLVALTKDGGQTWTYPPFIYTKLKTLVDPNFVRGVFESASCIDNGKKSICMAAGSYCTDQFCNNMFPLLAVTTDGGKTWSYPSSIFANLSSIVDPNFLTGFFSSVSCSGESESSFCVAAGQYTTLENGLPLLAFSTDNGATWLYPPSIHQNLAKQIDLNFLTGYFGDDATTGGKTPALRPLTSKLHTKWKMGQGVGRLFH